MENRFFNFIRSKKVLDLFCYIFCGIYLFFAIGYVIIDYSNKVNAQNQLNSLITNTNNINSRVDAEKKSKASNGINLSPNKQLFDNGKDALISSYNKLYNANSFYVEASGTFVTTVMGVTAKAGMKIKTIRFNENKKYDEKLNYFISASGFKSFVEPQTNNGKKILKTFDNYQVYETKVVNNQIADYSNARFFSSDKEKIISENLFIINEDTINNITYFKIKKDRNGNPLQYYVQAEMNPSLALTDFAKFMEYSAESLKTPVYSKFVVTACIDKNGNLTSMTTSDKSVIVRETPLGVKDCPCEVVLNYNVSKINEQIQFNLEGF